LSNLKRASAHLCSFYRSGLAFYLQQHPTLAALDVQPTLPRMSPVLADDDGHIALHTIMPASRIVLLSRCRVLAGFESMRVQGFDEATLKSYVQEVKGSSHPAVDPFFQDLAGNAWSAPTVMAIFIAVLSRCTSVQRIAYRVEAASSSSAVEHVDEALLDILRM
jgi:hypothetical protein